MGSTKLHAIRINVETHFVEENLALSITGTFLITPLQSAMMD